MSFQDETPSGRIRDHRPLPLAASGLPGRATGPERLARWRSGWATRAAVLAGTTWCLAALWACSPISSGPPPAGQALAFAQAHGFTPMLLRTAHLELMGFARTAGGKNLVVYIEGDGEAWTSRTTPSDDPSPRKPLVLSLASQDPAPDVLYLARPCQYLPRENWTGCSQSLWTNRRYGPEVVQALNQALDEAKAALGVQRLSLVGYSGGGVLAMLLAAKRTDVSDVMTVGANLDINQWASHHGISPLNGSLNPADTAAGFAPLPQTHFSGSKDFVSPPFLCRDFVARQGSGSLARCVEIEGASHADWASHWTEMLNLHRSRTEVRSAQ